MSQSRVKRAIISVSDKSGLIEFAHGLVLAGVEIYSTGGTAKFLQQGGLRVFEVATYTGAPEMMGGRVKTLHPKIFGGILFRRDRADDLSAVAENEIAAFDLVVVNLYPFVETISRPDVTWDEAVEQIDIGGPSLIRAAAKNHAFVAVVTKASQYQPILEEIKSSGECSHETRRRLALEAYELTAQYDLSISKYFSEQIDGADHLNREKFPGQIHLQMNKVESLRYGENPHQDAALYRDPSFAGASVVTGGKVHGKELSYNNILDLDSALALVRSLEAPASVVIKHNTPCGAAEAQSLDVAIQRALEGDPLSAFGGIIGCNHPVDAAAAEVLCEPGLFIEAILAPHFEPRAIEILTTKPKWKKNVRLVEIGTIGALTSNPVFRQVQGGMLVQNADVELQSESDWKVVTTVSPSDDQRKDLRFAWKVVRHVKSNAIVVAANAMLLGAGGGQTSRVDAVEIALKKAGERARGASLASDAFFPFPDSIERASAAGVKAIIQPGDSVKDADVIEACNQHGIAMIFTHRRHFRH